MMLLVLFLPTDHSHALGTLTLNFHLSPFSLFLSFSFSFSFSLSLSLFLSFSHSHTYTHIYTPFVHLLIHCYTDSMCYVRSQTNTSQPSLESQIITDRSIFLYLDVL